MDRYFLYDMQRAAWRAWWKNAWNERLPCTNIAFDSNGTLYRIDENHRTRHRVGDKRR